MGDIIHTLPAVTALRQAFPEASFGWVVEERWAELLCTLPEPRSGPRSPRRPLVDRVAHGEYEGMAQVPAFQPRPGSKSRPDSANSELSDMTWRSISRARFDRHCWRVGRERP